MSFKIHVFLHLATRQASISWIFTQDGKTGKRLERFEQQYQQGHHHQQQQPPVSRQTAHVANLTAGEDDRKSLMVLHNASNGRAWSRGDGQPWRGWGLQEALLEWTGVTVRDGRALVLNLYLCNLMGEWNLRFWSLSSMRTRWFVFGRLRNTVSVERTAWEFCQSLIRLLQFDCVPLRTV